MTAYRYRPQFSGRLILCFFCDIWRGFGKDKINPQPAEAQTPYLAPNPIALLILENLGGKSKNVRNPDTINKQVA